MSKMNDPIAYLTRCDGKVDFNTKEIIGTQIDDTAAGLQNSTYKFTTGRTIHALYVHINFLTHDDIVTIEVDYVIIAIHYKKSHLFLDSAIQYTVTSSGPPKARPLKCM